MGLVLILHEDEDDTVSPEESRRIAQHYVSG